MSFCSQCGKEVLDQAEFCVNCGCRLKGTPAASENDNNKIIRFLLTFFLGWIGSLIINHTSLKPTGWKSRTCAYLFLSIVTFGIYELVASICNITFDPNKESNIGYFKDQQ